MFTHFFSRVTKYEFWPFWLFYGVLTPYFIYYIFKTKAPAYFCNVNPLIRFGGFYDYSKNEILAQFSSPTIPETLFIPHSKIKSFRPNFYPFVAKPNSGERGKNVAIINNQSQWEKYNSLVNEDLIVQEYIDLPLEFGLFYVRYPQTQKGQIISITAKEFLWIEGDGQSTLKDLIRQNLRSFMIKDELFTKFSSQLDLVLTKGEKLLLSEIGNHYRGTKFLDASDLIHPTLERKVDEIMQSMQHFYYGRLDVKTNSIEDLQNGNFVILEINGANSEATQLYDPKYSVFEAWKIARKLLQIQYTVAKQNYDLGFDYPSWKPLAKALLKRLN